MKKISVSVSLKAINFLDELVANQDYYNPTMAIRSIIERKLNLLEVGIKSSSPHIETDEKRTFAFSISEKQIKEIDKLTDNRSEFIEKAIWEYSVYYKEKKS